MTRTTDRPAAAERNGNTSPAPAAIPATDPPGRQAGDDGGRIVRIVVDRVYVPFREEVHWSAGTRPGATRLIVRVETADGVVGFGETICLHEFVEPVLVKTLVPLAIGESVFGVERIARKAEGAGYYHHKRALVMALCGLEIALWDNIGRRAGLPLQKLWGGGYRDSVPIVAYLQASRPDRIAEEAARLAAEGYTAIKIKLGSGEASDIELVRAVREAAGPDVRLRADVNGAWTIGTAKRQLRKLEEFDLEYLEQPLPLEDLAGHALLRRLTSIPIALDESAYTLQDVFAIVRHEAADVILIDPHEAGGLAATRKQAAVAESAGLPVTLHSGGELGLSTAAYLHLAASIPNLLGAIDTQYPNMSTDVIRETLPYQGGRMTPPTGPGLGVTLDESRVEALRTDRIANPYLDPARPDWFPTKPQY